MVDHVQGRAQMLLTLTEELVGPSPQGEPLDCSGDLAFPTPEAAHGPWRQKGTLDEILMRDAPSKRFGVGVLYPAETVEEEPGADGPENGASGLESPGAEQVLTEMAHETAEQVGNRTGRRGERDSDDFDLAGANNFKPSSLGVSFLAEFPAGSKLIVEVPSHRPDNDRPTNGRYDRKRVRAGSSEWTWWLRRSVSFRAEATDEVLNGRPGRHVLPLLNGQGLGNLKLSVELFLRPQTDGDRRLVTVCLLNRKKAAGQNIDADCLFQAYFRVRVVTPDERASILPYPTRAELHKLDEEEQSLALLYRRSETFAVGHGCAADWASLKDGRVEWVAAEVLPSFETPSITPDITDEKGNPVQASMVALAGLDPSTDGRASLREVIRLYEAWIQKQRAEVAALPIGLQAAGIRHMNACEAAATRMKRGLNLIETDPKSAKAFRWANHAMLLQQVRSGLPLREIEYHARTNSISFKQPYTDPDPRNPGKFRGSWRAFQIAFLLESLVSAIDGAAPERETVDLIWFPTGGGKTEAYLGLAAFSMFHRRLVDRSDAGVHVIMRYTLRLLTAQQFQRASSLLCAMDFLRSGHTGELGDEPFSIGIWLGGDNTPNTRDEAVRILDGLRAGNPRTENKFVITRCPWCGAQMGPIPHERQMPRNAPRVVGYEARGGTVQFVCPDDHCHFYRGLPMFVTDEDIYDRRPSLVIGTVDKFAMLAWRPRARALFGLNDNGRRCCSPPGLIIQDELHLISGPLGSLVGLYEAVIEELCTDRRGKAPVKPKIICSTATIRRYKRQIMALYGRADAVLFPPPGMDASDSFFAQYALAPDGTPARGRLYVGIHGTGLGSMQTAQVRSFTALLQGAQQLSPDARDPWWSLLIFFNSLRELGTTLTLLQSDIPDRLVVLQSRFGLDRDDMRRLNNIAELTSRLRADEVPKAIQDLSVTFPSAQNAIPVDVCLASNIIEVGIDIDRLSLMAVVGQPKTTSQYIQVTGRVGRRWSDRPGLVAMLYSPAKPRDRSHFEKFRTYHERLYAQVEPTSVTPFSPPVLDRALHAVMVAYARQAGDDNAASWPHPCPTDILKHLRQLLLRRVLAIDPNEVPTFERVFSQRLGEWEQWERTAYDRTQGDENTPLLRMPGAYVSDLDAEISWATPTSMRNVDAECQVEVSRLFLRPGGEHDA